MKEKRQRKTSSWCDELAGLDSSDWDTLLSALVKEGVLIFQNGKYAVRQICTERLFSENPTEWALKQIGNAWSGDEEKVILKLIEKKETAICIEGFPNDTSFKRIGYKEAGGCFFQLLPASLLALAGWWIF